LHGEHARGKQMLLHATAALPKQESIYLYDNLLSVSLVFVCLTNKTGKAKGKENTWFIL